MKEESHCLLNILDLWLTEQSFFGCYILLSLVFFFKFKTVLSEYICLHIYYRHHIHCCDTICKWMDTLLLGIINFILYQVVVPGNAIFFGVLQKKKQPHQLCFFHSTICSNLYALLTCSFIFLCARSEIEFKFML